MELILPLHRTWRPHQKETVEQILSSQHKFVLLNAPPGSGKSICAISTALNAGHKRTVITTATKQLSDQYKQQVDDSIGLRVVEGRANFPCLIKRDRTADRGPCTVGYKCFYKMNGDCPYYKQKQLAVEAPIAVMNVAYFLYEANYTGGFSGIDYLVTDEAHKLDESIARFVEIRLTKASLQSVGIAWPGILPPSKYIEYFQEDIETINADYQELTGFLSLEPNNELLMSRAEILLDTIRTLGRFQMVTDDWFIEQDDKGLTFKPVWISDLANNYIYRHSTKHLLMSATLPEQVAGRLGIKDYQYIDVPSHFPKENRPLIYIPIANMARSAPNPTLENRKLLAAIDSILGKFSESKGLIHTISYPRAEFIVRNSKYSNRLLTHKTPLERAEALARYRYSKEPVVLVSPSFSEGVDLPYDLCRFQIISKIPYGDLGDRLTALRMNDDPEWYSLQAIISLVQMYGRAMRAADDRGVTYILDSCLDTLMRRYSYIVAKTRWFAEALQIQQDGIIKSYELEVPGRRTWN